MHLLCGSRRAVYFTSVLLIVGTTLGFNKAGASVYAQDKTSAPEKAGAADKITPPDKIAAPDVPIEVAFTKQAISAEWASHTTIIALNDSEAARSRRLAGTALNKYPQGFLKDRVKHLYIAAVLQYDGVALGGFAAADLRSVYITDAGSYYTDYFIECEAHHEMTHILTDSMPPQYAALWKACNPPGFAYGSGGFDAVAGGRYTDNNLDAAFLSRGFTGQYAVSDMREDVADIYENLFMGNLVFWKAVGNYPALKKKVEVAIQFYHSLDERFTPQWFEDIREQSAKLPPANPQPPHAKSGDLIVFPYGGFIVFPGVKGGPSYQLPVPVGGVSTFPPGGSFILNPKSK